MRAGRRTGGCHAGAYGIEGGSILHFLRARHDALPSLAPSAPPANTAGPLFPCRCGTSDDDGERMIACDGCGVWAHMLCNGIPVLDEDEEEEEEGREPPHWTCDNCLAKAPAGAAEGDGAGEAPAPASAKKRRGG